jgi:protein TonB
MDLALSVPVTFSSLLGGRDSASRCWRRALSVSVALHGLVLGMLVQQHSLSTKLPVPPLQVVLSRPAAPTVAAALMAPPVTSRPVHPRPVSKHMRAGEASPVAMSVPARPIVEESAPPVPEVAAVPQSVPAPVASRAMPDAIVLAGFNRLLSQTIERQKRYPRIALVRHWEGTAVLKLNIGTDGRLQDFRLMSSSGHDSLDRQALEMLRDALPLPTLPAQLAGLDLSIDIPVTFRIAD